MERYLASLGSLLESPFCSFFLGFLLLLYRTFVETICCFHLEMLLGLTLVSLINESLLSFGVPCLSAMLCLLIINHTFWIADTSVAILHKRGRQLLVYSHCDFANDSEKD